MREIYHVANELEFKNSDTEYFPKAFQLEGFIHLCTKEQLPGVIERYYPSIEGFILLKFSEDQIGDRLKWEGKTELFPHFYSKIDKKLVLEVLDLKDFLETQY